MNKYFLVLFFSVLLLPSFISAQTNDIKIGSDLSQFKQTNGALYDFSDPDKVNVKVAIWGFVRFPGRYIVPMNTSVQDLISYAGGPTDAAKLDDLRLFRTLADSTQKIYKFNLNELLYEPGEKKLVLPPPLIASDIVLVPGEPRWYLKDYITLYLSVISAASSLAILIWNIVRK